MFKRLVLCLACSTVASFAASVNMWVHDLDSNATIAKVDVATGVVTLVGNAGVSLTDMAFAPDGTLYGIGSNELYRISTSTGLATPVGSLAVGAANANALVFSSTGTLYTATQAGGFYTVNTTTGAASLVGSIGIGSGGDLAFVNGKLYLATIGNTLVQINTSTGAGSLIGAFGISNVFGLATPDNSMLYAVANQTLYTVNLTTGAATFDVTWANNPQGLGNAGGEAFLSEAGAGTETPEPAPIALSLIGLAMLYFANKALLKANTNSRSCL